MSTPTNSLIKDRGAAITSVVPGNLAVSATDKIIGRASAGAGGGEEITCTSFARTLLDDADAATARATLGVSGGGTPDAHASTHAAAGSDPVTLTTAQVTGLDAALTPMLQVPEYDIVTDSLVPPSLSSDEWEYQHSTYGVSPCRKNHEGDVMNPNAADASANALRSCLFVVPPNCTSLTLTVRAKRLGAADKTRLVICDASVSTAYGSLNATLTDSFADYTVTWASPTPGALARVLIYSASASYAPQPNTFVVESVKLTPTCSSGLFASSFKRLGLRTLSYSSYRAKTTECYPLHACRGIARFVTTATQCAVELLGQGNTTPDNQVGITVADTDFQYAAASAGLQLASFSTLAAGSKTIQVDGGTVNRNGGPGTAETGQQLRAVYVPATDTLAIPDVSAAKLTIYADSIHAGKAVNLSDSVVHKLRVRNSGRIALEAFANRSLSEMSDAVAMAKSLASHGSHRYLIAIGTNDWSYARMTAANYGAAYASLLDALLQVDPLARVWCVTLFERSSSTTPNSNAEVLEQFNQQIVAAARSRRWCVVVHGNQILPAGNLSDGVHPNATGHNYLATAYQSLFGL